MSAQVGQSPQQIVPQMQKGAAPAAMMHQMPRTQVAPGGMPQQVMMPGGPGVAYPQQMTPQMMAQQQMMGQQMMVQQVPGVSYAPQMQAPGQTVVVVQGGRGRGRDAANAMQLLISGILVYILLGTIFGTIVLLICVGLYCGSKDKKARKIALAAGITCLILGLLTLVMIGASIGVIVWAASSVRNLGGYYSPYYY